MNREKKMPPKIKICGLTRECDMDYVNEAHPDYIGLVFAPSRRQVTLQDARSLRNRLTDDIQVVGVFVNEQPQLVESLLEEGIIDIAQLHGREDITYVEHLKKRTECCIIKAMPSDREAKAGIYKAYEEAGVDYFLFDSSDGLRMGGTGKTFDWKRIPKVSVPCFLAGGLCAANVEEAMKRVQPYALDISSGVEINGYKDREKILEIVRRIRNV